MSWAHKFTAAVNKQFIGLHPITQWDLFKSLHNKAGKTFFIRIFCMLCCWLNSRIIKHLTIADITSAGKFSGDGEAEGLTEDSKLAI